MSIEVKSVHRSHSKLEFTIVMLIRPEILDWTSWRMVGARLLQFLKFFLPSDRFSRIPIPVCFYCSICLTHYICNVSYLLWQCEFLNWSRNWNRFLISHIFYLCCKQETQSGVEGIFLGAPPLKCSFIVVCPPNENASCIIRMLSWCR